MWLAVFVLSLANELRAAPRCELGVHCLRKGHLVCPDSAALPAGTMQTQQGPRLECPPLLPRCSCCFWLACWAGTRPPDATVPDSFLKLTLLIFSVGSAGLVPLYELPIWVRKRSRAACRNIASSREVDHGQACAATREAGPLLLCCVPAREHSLLGTPRRPQVDWLRPLQRLAWRDWGQLCTAGRPVPTCLSGQSPSLLFCCAQDPPRSIQARTIKRDVRSCPCISQLGSA